MIMLKELTEKDRKKCRFGLHFQPILQIRKEISVFGDFFCGRGIPFIWWEFISYYKGILKRSQLSLQEDALILQLDITNVTFDWLHTHIIKKNNKKKANIVKINKNQTKQNNIKVMVKEVSVIQHTLTHWDFLRCSVHANLYFEIEFVFD